MKLVLNDARLLKEPISIISELVNEVKLKFLKDKIELIAMDPANISMVVFHLLASALQQYEASDEEIVISLDNLKNILKRAKPNDQLVMELQDNKLKIQLKGESIRNFDLSLLDLSVADQKVPELKFNVKVKTNTALLNEAIEDASVISDALCFAVRDGKFIVDTEGNFSKANIELASETFVESSVQEARAKYAIEYLKKIAKGAKLADNVTLQFDTDYPLRVDYEVKDKLLLAFLLAPRVSNE